eukprot:GHVU01220916.1.p4 GENE.GHVU01220916.1~~GHVU01220916.1.p4  ORF type:complete len:115 (-),score=38.53 GHVU01220916.1:1417-1761(-)
MEELIVGDLFRTTAPRARGMDGCVRCPTIDRLRTDEENLQAFQSVLQSIEGGGGGEEEGTAAAEGNTTQPLRQQAKEKENVETPKNREIGDDREMRKETEAGTKEGETERHSQP